MGEYHELFDSWVDNVCIKSIDQEDKQRDKADNGTTSKYLFSLIGYSDINLIVVKIGKCIDYTDRSKNESNV